MCDACHKLLSDDPTIIMATGLPQGEKIGIAGA
jgi:hypothetical protein